MITSWVKTAPLMVTEPNCVWSILGSMVSHRSLPPLPSQRRRPRLGPHRARPAAGCQGARRADLAHGHPDSAYSASPLGSAAALAPCTVGGTPRGLAAKATTRSPPGLAAGGGSDVSRDRAPQTA